MRVERVIHLEPHEQTQLAFLAELARADTAIKQLRWQAVRDAVAMGLSTRMIGRAAEYSPAQVSRVSTGLQGRS